MMRVSNSMALGFVTFRGQRRLAARDADGRVYLNRGLFVVWLSSTPLGRNVAATWSEEQ